MEALHLSAEEIGNGLRHCAEQQHIEVVQIGSDSLDTVRRTHANEFDGTAALERLLPAG